MSRYTLEVIAPVEEGELASVLDAVAVIHGGTVVESSGTAGKRYRRQYVNILDCESSLEGEVDWLRSQFPDARFTIKELA